MKNREFLERMIFLTQKMCDLYNQEPIDQNALDEVRREIHDAGQAYNSDYKRMNILSPAVIIVLLLILAFVVYTILI